MNCFDLMYLESAKDSVKRGLKFYFTTQVLSTWDILIETSAVKSEYVSSCTECTESLNTERLEKQTNHNTPIEKTVLTFCHHL